MCAWDFELLHLPCQLINNHNVGETSQENKKLHKEGFLEVK